MNYKDMPNLRDSSRARVLASIDKSLKNLGTDYVDLYLIHNPRQVEDLEQAWREFEKIKETVLSMCVLAHFYPAHLC